MSHHDPRQPRAEPAVSPRSAASAPPLTDEAIAALASTAVKLARFADDVSEPEALAILIDAVAASARANESISQLRERLMLLGDRVVTVAREVANFL